MKSNRLMWIAMVCLFAGIELWAQQPNTPSEGTGTSPADAVNVPRLIKFSGAMKDFTGKPLVGPVDINFAIYKQQTDAEPVWQEMQTLQLDEQGRYTVLLGAMQPEGLPMELFSSGEARWLEVNAAGTELQPRTLLVSVPYALKASDAETLGGKPASAYLLAPVNQTGSGTTQATKGSSTAATGNTTILAPVITPNVITATQNYIPVLTDNSGDMGNSTMYQFGTQVGIATTTPGTLNGHYFPSLLLDAAQATASTYLTADTELQGGYAGILLNRGAATANNRDWAIENQPDATLTSSQLAISTYNDAGYPTAMLMVTRSGLVGIGTTTPGATLEVNGTGKFDGGVAVAGLTAGNCVQAGAGGFLTTTASPCGSGGGTITGVTAGTDLTGGGTSGNVTLNLDTTKVATLAASSNAFTGSITASSFAGNGAGLTGVSASGLAAGTYSNAYTFNNAANSFTGNGSGLTGVSASGLAAGTYSNPYTFNNAANSFTAASVTAGSVSASNGVTGTTSSSVGYAVYGNNTATTGYPYGVVGVGFAGVVGSSTSGAGYGVYGTNLATTGLGYGVYGVSSSSNGVGVYGSSNTGVYGFSTSTGAGVLGQGDSFGVYSNGNFAASGTKSAVAVLPDGRAVLLYSVESPENWYEDFGSGQLQNGVASIELDPTFAQTVSPEAGYHVFVTPNGDCEGLYVAQKTGTGFEVRELRGGKSSVAFDYRIVAKRKGLESLRLEEVSADHETAEAMRKQLAERPSHVPKLHLPKPTEALKALPRLPKIEAPPAVPAAVIPKPPEPAKLPALAKPPQK